MLFPFIIRGSVAKGGLTRFLGASLREREVINSLTRTFDRQGVFRSSHLRNRSNISASE